MNNFFRAIRPVLSRAGALNSKLNFKLINDYRAIVERLLRKSGNPLNVSADEFIAIQEILSISFSLLIFLAFGSVNVFIAAGLAAGAFIYPLIYVNDVVKKKQYAVSRSLPDVLDLLTLCVEAGLDFNSAALKVVEKSGRNPISDEFSHMLRQMKVGMTRRESLREIGRRVDQKDFSNFVSTMVQADQLGTSMGSVLRIQSEQMRMNRNLLAEKRAMEAPVKLLFPLLGFIFPAVFVMLFGPIFLSATR